MTPIANLLNKAGKNLLRDFGELMNLQNAISGNQAFIQAAYQRTETALHQGMHELYPQHDILLAKGGLLRYGGQEQAVWAIDVLNGIENFAHGIPHIALSVGLKERGQLLARLIMVQEAGGFVRRSWETLADLAPSGIIAEQALFGTRRAYGSLTASNFSKVSSG
jgi:3'-phosphoadenosine 5'-phosphosulfate (PAPS) 3'-phosphatase